MNNLDEDFKSFCEDLYYFVDDDMGGHFEQVIGNQIANTKLGYLIFKEKLEKQDKELETYKKIAEKLADDLMSLPEGNYYYDSKEELLDKARKEVENDE